MATMTFNTGRGYTPDGQIIHVYMDDGSTVRFYDISRDISGTLHTPFGGDDLKTFVMDEYDAGRYDDDSTA